MEQQGRAWVHGWCRAATSGQDPQISPSLPQHPNDEHNIIRVSCEQAYPLDDEAKPRGTAGAMGYASVIYKASASEALFPR